MPFEGYQVYDDEEFFEQYIQKRAKGNAPNELLEEPIINELLGNVAGKKILDLGCGDGRFGAILLEKGAQAYDGIEGSANMVGLAQKQLQAKNAKIIHQDITEAVLGKAVYDIVLSRLVLHYIPHLEPLLNNIHQALKINGQFICSIEHPIITSCYDAYHQKVKRGNWIVDNYFSAGERINHWMGKPVVKYHKTIEAYWQLFRAANFELLQLRESKPDPSRFIDAAEYERRSRIPLFMLFQLQKK